MSTARLIHKIFGNSAKIDAKPPGMVCNYCQPLQFPKSFVKFNRFEHHKSYAALVKSASDGCELCAGFARCLEASGKELVGTKELVDQTFLDAFLKNFEKSILVKEEQFWCEMESQHFVFYQGHKTANQERLDVPRIEVEACVDHGQPALCEIRGRPVQLHSDSEECLRLTRAWLKECQSSHINCHRRKPDPLPLRVIEVGSSLKEPFLYHPSKNENEAWVTLSHCWGESRPLTTTLANLAKHGESIPMSALPPVFRDAVMLTRKLGFRFLWVDSLCIIQDSQQDWAEQSTKMHEIYSKATLCIAASSARGSHEGIFKTGNQSRGRYQPFASIPFKETKKRCNNDKSTVGTVSFRRRTLFAMGMENHLLLREPLHKRAWVLQESALSPRCVDFTSEQLIWSCRSAVYSEAVPHDNHVSTERPSSSSTLFAIPVRKRPMHSCPDIEHFVSSPMKWWNNSVGDFMLRDITKQTDRLPAMAGIAAAIKARTHYKYVSGLWKEDLHRGLLWTSKLSNKRSTNESVPTWSWASSSSGGISYPFETWRYAPTSRAEIVDVHVETEGGQEFAPVIRASLVITSHYQLLSSAPWRHSPPKDLMTANRVDILDRKLDKVWPGKSLMQLILDEEDNTPFLPQSFALRGVICFQIATFVEENLWAHNSSIVTKNTVHGLLLEPCEGAVDTFRRIGVVIFPQWRGVTDGWPTRTVTII